MFLVGMPIAIFLFTFHYVSIKSTDKTTENTEGNIFTFHYVSIKSYIIRDREGGNTNLHSTMYLLNRNHVTVQPAPHGDLHSTMYLLNHIYI